MNIETIESPDERWDELVADVPGAGLFHRTAWLRVWRQEYGQPGVLLVARNGAAAEAVLPLVRRSSRLFGRYWISMPYFDAAGAVGEASATQALVELAAQKARKRGDEYVEIRMEAEQPWSWQCSRHKVHVLLDLPDDDAALLKGFKAKLRSQVRRAEREQPALVEGGEELAAEFHEVYSQKMRELGSPAHAPRLFARVARAFPDACRILLVRLQGRCVAGAVLLQDRDRVIIPWAASLSEVNRLAMNMFLYASALRFSISRGARCFDFGRCNADDPQHLKFKLQWGGAEHALHWYRVAGAKELEAAGEGPGRMLQLGTKVWPRLPLGVTRLAGPYLVRHF